MIFNLPSICTIFTVYTSRTYRATSSHKLFIKGNQGTFDMFVQSGVLSRHKFTPKCECLKMHKCIFVCIFEQCWLIGSAKADGFFTYALSLWEIGDFAQYMPNNIARKTLKKWPLSHKWVRFHTSAKFRVKPSLIYRKAGEA